MKLPSWMFSGHTTTTVEKPTVQQMQELIEEAEDYDRLTNMKGWARIVQSMVEEINGEIAKATAQKMCPDIMVVYVQYWNAKRELLDNALGRIADIRKQRDEIVEQFKTKEDSV